MSPSIHFAHSVDQNGLFYILFMGMCFVFHLNGHSIAHKYSHLAQPILAMPLIAKIKLMPHKKNP